MRERFIPSVIYKHFKGGLYASLFVSKAIDSDELIDLANENFFMTTTHTESGKTIIIFKDDTGAAMHSSHECNDDLAIYTSLSIGTTYARPLDEFVSEVDRNKYPLEKYPTYSQKYRLEVVEYSVQNKNKIKRENVFLSDENATVVFGDGKVGIFNGKCADKDGQNYPLLVINELDKPIGIGTATKFSDEKKEKIHLEGLGGQDINLIFKSEASIDVLMEELAIVKKSFSNISEVSEA